MTDRKQAQALREALRALIIRMPRRDHTESIESPSNAAKLATRIAGEFELDVDGRAYLLEAAAMLSAPIRSEEEDIVFNPRLGSIGAVMQDVASEARESSVPRAPTNTVSDHVERDRLWGRLRRWLTASTPFHARRWVVAGLVLAVVSLGVFLVINGVGNDNNNPGLPSRPDSRSGGSAFYAELPSAPGDSYGISPSPDPADFAVCPDVEAVRSRIAADGLEVEPVDPPEDASLRSFAVEERKSKTRVRVLVGITEIPAGSVCRTKIDLKDLSGRRADKDRLRRRIEQLLTKDSRGRPRHTRLRKGDLPTIEADLDKLGCIAKRLAPLGQQSFAFNEPLADVGTKTPVYFIDSAKLPDELTHLTGGCQTVALADDKPVILCDVRYLAYWSNVLAAFHSVLRNGSLAEVLRTTDDISSRASSCEPLVSSARPDKLCSEQDPVLTDSFIMLVAWMLYHENEHLKAGEFHRSLAPLPVACAPDEKFAGAAQEWAKPELRADILAVKAAVNDGSLEIDYINDPVRRGEFDWLFTMGASWVAFTADISSPHTLPTVNVSRGLALLGDSGPDSDKRVREFEPLIAMMSAVNRLHCPCPASENASAPHELAQLNRQLSQMFAVTPPQLTVVEPPCQVAVRLPENQHVRLWVMDVRDKESGGTVTILRNACLSFPDVPLDDDVQFAVAEGLIRIMPSSGFAVRWNEAHAPSRELAWTLLQLLPELQ